MTNNYDDEAWVNQIRYRAGILCGFFESIAKSNSERDFNMVSRLNEHLMEEIESAIKEDSNYNLSHNFKEAHKEWISCLQAYKSGGECTRTIAIDGQNGSINEEAISKIVNFYSKGTEHLTKVTKLTS